MIDFQGAKITSETGFLLMSEIDERFGILGPMGSELEDSRSWVHSKHSLIQMTHQSIYQMAAGYEDCNDADYLRIDPSLRLAIGKGEEAGAGQSRLSMLENEVLWTDAGLQALEDSLMRSNDTIMKRKKKQRLIVDVDSTEDLAHGKQENVAFNGHFGKNCFHPVFAFTSDGDCLGEKLRRATFIRPTAFCNFSIRLSIGIAFGSSSSGYGATRPLPIQRCTNIAKENGSCTLSGCPPMRSSTG